MTPANKERTVVCKDLTEEALEGLNVKDTILAELSEDSISLWELTDKSLIIWWTWYGERDNDAFRSMFDKVREFFYDKTELSGYNMGEYYLGFGHEIYAGPRLNPAFEYLETTLYFGEFQRNFYIS